ncbi:hypothetical protein ACF058_30285 [Streptomyces sp. NPDC015501]
MEQAAPPGIVPVRGFKHVSGRALTVPATAFSTIIAGFRAEGFGAI